MNHKIIITTFIVFVLSTSLAFAQETREKQETDYYTQEITDTKELKEIHKDRKVKVDYTLKANGQETKELKGLQHKKYTHGRNEMPKWLEAKLEGLRKGDSKTVTIPPEEAYGPVDQNGYQEWTKGDLPAGTRQEVGETVEIVLPEGLIMPAQITEVKEDAVILNFNHPLAGKTLTYDVTVADVQ